MTVTNLTVSSTPPATNAAVTNVLRSGTLPHGSTVTVARAGSQTTGDTTQTAYTVTTTNSIGGVAANVTQQIGYSSTANGSDNLISYASVAGQGVNFHTANPTDNSFTPPDASTNNAQATPADNTNSSTNVAAASTNAPPASPPPAASIQTQPATTAAAASNVPSVANAPPSPSANVSSASSNVSTSAAVPTQLPSAPTAPPPAPANDQGSGNQNTSSGGYTALANASASTIRGSNLNVVT